MSDYQAGGTIDRNEARYNYDMEYWGADDAPWVLIGDNAEYHVRAAAYEVVRVSEHGNSK